MQGFIAITSKGYILHRDKIFYTSIKTHGSELRGQEEAGRTRRTSELFTGSTAVKFVNALDKPPLKLSLSYQRLSTS